MTLSKPQRLSRAYELGGGFLTEAVRNLPWEIHDGLIRVAIKDALTSVAGEVQKYIAPKPYETNDHIEWHKQARLLAGTLSSFLYHFCKKLNYTEPNSEMLGMGFLPRSQKVFTEFFGLAENHLIDRIPTLEELSVSTRIIRLGNATESYVLPFPQTSTRFFEISGVELDGYLKVRNIGWCIWTDGKEQKLGILQGKEVEMPPDKVYRLLYYFDQAFSLEKIRNIENLRVKVFTTNDLSDAIEEYNERNRQEFQDALIKRFLEGFVDACESRV